MLDKVRVWFSHVGYMKQLFIEPGILKQHLEINFRPSFYLLICTSNICCIGVVLHVLCSGFLFCIVNEKCNVIYLNLLAFLQFQILFHISFLKAQSISIVKLCMYLQCARVGRNLRHAWVDVIYEDEFYSVYIHISALDMQKLFRYNIY